MTIIDPNWSNVTATTGLTATSIAPRNTWTTLTPVADGNLDVDFTVKVRSQYAAFQVRSDMPVKITSTPIRNP